LKEPEYFLKHIRRYVFYYDAGKLPEQLPLSIVGALCSTCGIPIMVQSTFETEFGSPPEFT
jgi:hypothetical protein